MNKYTYILETNRLGDPCYPNPCQDGMDRLLAAHPTGLPATLTLSELLSSNSIYDVIWALRLLDPSEELYNAMLSVRLELQPAYIPPKFLQEYYKGAAAGNMIACITGYFPHSAAYPQIHPLQPTEEVATAAFLKHFC